MDLSIFEEIGLTTSEVKIYLALNKLGISTAGPILDETKLQNSVVHATLNRLLTKGIISYIKKGNVKHYIAANPTILLDILDERRRKISEVIPELLELRKKKEIQEAEIFEGVKGFKVMYSKFIEDGKKDDEYFFFSFETKETEKYKNLFTFYDEMAKERLQKGIITKGILPKKNKELMEKGKPELYQGLLYVDFPVHTNISVFKDKVYFTPWEEKEITFLITSQQLANSFKKYFNSIWEENKKSIKYYK
jgi:sugar-specific transcriptional regulator TrmB